MGGQFPGGKLRFNEQKDLLVASGRDAMTAEQNTQQPLYATFFAKTLGLISSRWSAQTSAGMGVGLWCVLALGTLLESWGWSTPHFLGLSFAAIALAWMAPWIEKSFGTANRWMQLGCGLLMPLGLLLYPVLSQAFLSLVAISPESLIWPTISFGLAATVCGLPAAVYWRALNAQATTISGLGYGLILGSCFLVPMAGAIVAVVLMTGLFGFYCYLNPKAQPEAEPGTMETPAFSTSQLVPLLTGLVCGIGLWSLMRWNSQYMPFTAAQCCGVLAGVLFGVLGMQQLSRLTGKSITWKVLSFTTMLACAVTLCASLLMVDFTLWMNVTISSALLHSSLRFLLIASLALPWGAMLALTPGLNSSTTSASTKVTGLTVGLCLSALVFSGMISEIRLLSGLLVLSFAGVLISVGLPMISLAEAKGRRSSLLFTGFASLLFVGSLASSLSFHPEQNSRLLFSTQLFNSYRAGEKPEHIAVVDDTRLVTSATDRFGRFTAWSRTGVLTEFRSNGLPTGMNSLLTEVCPSSSTDVLPTLLPLIAHPKPQSVLILGMGSGEAHQTALAFPVHEIQVIEPSAGLMEVVTQNRQRVSTQQAQDDRLQLRNADVELALQSQASSFDIIVDQPGHSIDLTTLPRFSSAHYQRVHRNLNPQGIYVQRFTFTDYGSGPLQTLVDHLSPLFADVRLVDAGPGEMLLMASKSELQMVPDELLKRMQTPQAVQACANMGWDWSILLNLAQFKAEELNTAGFWKQWNASNAMAFQWPQEMMRWGDKRAEVQDYLVDHTSRWLEEYAEHPELEDLQWRLKEVVETRSLVTNHPDALWTYRAVLKERLSKSTRTKVVPVAGSSLERTVHPVDQRRLDYLEALGEFTQNKQVDRSSAQELLEMTWPYDPLTHFFAHEEIARMIRRTGSEDSLAELQHLLYLTFYAPQTDRSVRHVERALSLMTDLDPPLATEAMHYDVMNALIEQLHQRWTRRQQYQATSDRVTLLDVQNTLASVAKALNRMETLSDAITQTDQFASRQEVIDRQLVMPLNQLKGQLIRNFGKKDQPAKPE